MLGELLLVGLAAGELEVQDVALVQLDLLVVADVNLLGALGDEAHVVTDHEDPSLELLEAALRNGTVASKGEKQIRINQVRERMFLAIYDSSRGKTQPDNSTRLTARASILSMSRGFVGSSRRSMCGFSWAMMAKTMRAF